MQQVWYVIDAALLLFAIMFFFTEVGQGTSSTVGLIYYNALPFVGFFLVAVFLSLSMSRAYREKIQAETRQRAFQDLQDYTRNLEAMYEFVRMTTYFGKPPFLSCKQKQY